MTIKRRFTPEVMLSLPRRSSGTPSPDGKLVVYTQSTYSFETHARSREIRILEIANGQEVSLSKDGNTSEPKWLGHGYDIVWLKEGENGNTSFIVSDASAPGQTHTAGTVAGPVSNLKLHVIEPGVVAVAVAGQASPDGSLYNPKDEQKPRSSARIYDSLFVRHWDEYITLQRNSIFTALLRKAQPKVTSREGRYNLLGFTNALQGSKLETPIPPFGGTDHFDISTNSITFVAKDPDLNPATHTKCDLYLVKRQHPMDISSAPEPIKLAVPGLLGAASNPVFSPDGTAIAFLKMRKDGYESDKNRIVVVRNLPTNTSTGSSTASSDSDVEGEAAIHQHTAEVLADGTDAWDRSPSAILWSNDAKSLFLLAEDAGEGRLFHLSLTNPQHPRTLTEGGYVTDASPLSTASPLLFVSGNNLVDSSTYMIVDPTVSSAETTPSSKIISSLSQSGSLLGLSPTQVSSLWWRGADNHPVHAIMVVPSNFSAEHNAKYPLALLVHGGPQGAWNDQWGTRWNAAVFAEQGYVVVLPNPTGSTGYGQGFTDAIRNDWGGKPYQDLVLGMDFIENELEFVDMERCVALGASYGGYMMNWIQGHQLAKRFKALVCHDGVFSMTGQVASEEQYFPVHDQGGPIWERQEVYDRWDPARHTGKWETPMLVIHNELDYRLTMAEGLSAFNVLQMRGVESRFVTFKDENHWVLKEENSLVWHCQVLGWINRFVGLGSVVDREGRDGTEYLRGR